MGAVFRPKDLDRG